MVRGRVGAALTLILVLTLGVLAGAAGPAGAAPSPNVVISQVYGGGGNANAPYNADYVELYNRGPTAIPLTGWSIQYASANGSGNFGATTTQITELSGSIAPGGYVLIQEASGATGNPLPA